jgi:hypothetical protein
VEALSRRKHGFDPRWDHHIFHPIENQPRPRSSPKNNKALIPLARLSSDGGIDFFDTPFRMAKPAIFNQTTRVAAFMLNRLLGILMILVMAAQTGMAMARYLADAGRAKNRRVELVAQ